MEQIPKILALLETSRVFDRQLLRGIGQYSRLHGPWTVHVVSDRLDSFQLPTNWRDCAGIIARIDSARLVRTVNATNAPVVSVDGFGDPLAHQLAHHVGDVFADAHGIARLAAKHFADRDFTQFAFVGLPRRGYAKLRCKSFGEVARRAGHPLFVYPARDAPRLPWIEEREILAKWLEDLPKPVGLMACDDERGLQILDACRLACISVPDQIAVIGVGNDNLICDMAAPPLSSVALDAVHGGFQAAHMLGQALRRKSRFDQQLLVQPNDVVVRASTDIYSSQDPHVNAARGIIRREFCQDFSIDSLARTVGISRRALEAKFRKHTGKTIWEEVQELRIARTKMILKETGLPIAEVAALSGYQSVSHLVQLFAKETGLTPAKYRIAARVSAKHKESRWPLENLNRNIA